MHELFSVILSQAMSWIGQQAGTCPVYAVRRAQEKTITT